MPVLIWKADIAADEVSKNLAEVSSFAQKIGVNGVPAVFINGKQVNGRSSFELQEAINAAK